jgi:hypothetical protein
MKTNNSNNQSKSGHQVMTRLAVAVVATLALTVQVIAPAFAQAADSYLPPEVVPLDPQVASQLAQAQAKARELNPVNRGLNVSADGIGDPTNAGISAGAMNSRTMKQDMMQSLTSSNNGAQFGNMNNNPMPQGNMGNMGNAAAQAAPATTGTSDWIMPEKQSGQAGIATNYGNVEQTQTLSGQTQQQAVRHNTSRGGSSNAISGMAGFLGGAILGSALRRPGSMMGMGMYPFMMGGFGPTSAFRY